MYFWKKNTYSIGYYSTCMLLKVAAIWCIIKGICTVGITWTILHCCLIARRLFLYTTQQTTAKLFDELETEGGST